jgi:hypothetical protein
MFKKCLYLCTPAKNAGSCTQVRAMLVSASANGYAADV